jgi:hypothetical protein
MASVASASSTTISSLPYTASQRGSNFSETLYVAGTNLVSATDGINFTGHDIVLNLGTDTLSFAHSDSATGSGGVNDNYNTYGVKVAGDCYNIKVIGGVIMADPIDTNSTYLNCVSQGRSHDVTFEGTKFVIPNGYNSHCVGGVGNLYNIDFNHCIFEDKITGYRSRCDFSGVAVQLYHNYGYGTQGAQDGYHHFRFYGCKIDTANGGAFHFGGIKVFLEACTTYVDNRNDFYTYPNGGTCEGTTNNGHCTATLLQAGSYIKNNYMVSRFNQDGTDMGILIEVAQGTEMNPVVVCSNYVDVKAGLDAHYGWMNAKALKTRYHNRYLQIFDNTFIARSSGDYPNCETYNYLSGFYNSDWDDGNYPDSFVTIENNYFEARADDGDFNSNRAVNFAITRDNGYVWHNAGNVWRNNHVKSAGNVYEFSGYDGPCSNMLIDKDIVEYDPNNYGRSRYTFKVGYYLPSVNNIARDCIYVGGASDTSITFGGSYDASIRMQRTLRILVLGNNECPVANANVTVVDNYGHTVLSGATSPYGLLTGPVTYYFEARNSSDSTNYNDFTITASRDGENKVSTLTVNRENAADTLRFDSVEGDCDIDITPPAAIEDLGAAPGADDGEIDLTWTAPGDDGDVGMADHYEIIYATYPITEGNWEGATLCVGPPSPTSPGSPQEYTITGLAEGGTFYVAIRTFDDMDWESDLSNVVLSFAAGIQMPTPLETEIDSVNYSATLTALAVESYYPLYYVFELDSLDNYPDPEINIDLSADTLAEVTFANLSDEVTYFWRVCAVAIDGSDTSAWSPSVQFDLLTGVNSTLTSSDCVYPLDGSTVHTSQPYLEVNSLPDIQFYYFQVDDNNQFSDPIQSGAVPKSSGTTTRWQVSDPLEAGQNYYWRVSPNGVIYTAPLSFTAVLDIHPFPNPFRPAEGHTLVTFTNLVANSNIVIATISGDIVYRQDSIGPADWTWDVKNDRGQDLAPGVYLYNIDFPSGSVGGTLMVVK